MLQRLVFLQYVMNTTLLIRHVSILAFFLKQYPNIVYLLISADMHIGDIITHRTDFLSQV